MEYFDRNFLSLRRTIMLICQSLSHLIKVILYRKIKKIQSYKLKKKKRQINTYKYVFDTNLIISNN